MSTTTFLPPLPFLQQLYDMVLARSDKRMPRWKVRLQPDVLLELQPKAPRRRYRFEGRRFEFRAARCEGITPTLLQQSRSCWPKPWMVQGGRVGELCDGTDRMYLGLAGAQWSRDGYDDTARQDLRETVAQAFSDGRFAEFSVTRLFHPYCLCCGKALTDPVSMARFIGPECAGTSSSHIRRLLEAAEPGSYALTTG